MEVATQSFIEHGYFATTIAKVAEGAELSAESVYVIFKNKRELLRAAVEFAALDTDDGGEVVRDEWLAAVRAEPDQRRRFALMTEAMSDGLRRVAPMDEVVRVAATTDPEIAKLQDERERKRRRDIRVLVDLLAAVGPLRMPAAEAADLMWAMSRSTGFSLALADGRHWSHKRASAALDDALTRMLLPD